MDDEYRIIVSGWRKATPEQHNNIIGDTLSAIVFGYAPVTDRRVVIHHGAARGVDTIVRNQARLVGWREIPHPADWDKYGKPAGVIRNDLMLKEANPHIVVAFPHATSIGTMDMIKRAIKAHVDLVVRWLQ